MAGPRAAPSARRPVLYGTGRQALALDEPFPRRRFAPLPRSSRQSNRRLIPLRLRRSESVSRGASGSCSYHFAARSSSDHSVPVPHSRRFSLQRSMTYVPWSVISVSSMQDGFTAGRLTRSNRRTNREISSGTLSEDCPHGYRELPINRNRAAGPPCRGGRSPGRPRSMHRGPSSGNNWSGRPAGETGRCDTPGRSCRRRRRRDAGGTRR